MSLGSHRWYNWQTVGCHGILYKDGAKLHCRTRSSILQFEERNLQHTQVCCLCFQSWAFGGASIKGTDGGETVYFLRCTCWFHLGLSGIWIRFPGISSCGCQAEFNWNRNKLTFVKRLLGGEQHCIYNFITQQQPWIFDRFQIHKT